MKKLLFIFSIALIVCACGTKSNESPRALDESINLLSESIDDPSIPFEEYQPVFDEILDSLQYDVLNDPDADWRFVARQLPANILGKICMSEPEQKRDSIWDLYIQRWKDILYTWYVQELIDSTDNSPFFIMSYAAPYDTDGKDTRVGFTFSETSTPQNEPIMIIGVPVKAEDPLILFSEWDEYGNEISSNTYTRQNNNVMVLADSCQTHIMLTGSFLYDMLMYPRMSICYLREDAPEYMTAEKDIYKLYVTEVPVDLHQFQLQYRAAYQWMEDYQ